MLFCSPQEEIFNVPGNIGLLQGYRQGQNGGSVPVGNVSGGNVSKLEMFLEDRSSPSVSPLVLIGVV